MSCWHIKMNGAPLFKKLLIICFKSKQALHICLTMLLGAMRYAALHLPLR